MPRWLEVLSNALSPILCACIMIVALVALGDWWARGFEGIIR